jgi:hypothetical protein
MYTHRTRLWSLPFPLTLTCPVIPQCHSSTVGPDAVLWSYPTLCTPLKETWGSFLFFSHSLDVVFLLCVLVPNVKVFNASWLNWVAWGKNLTGYSWISFTINQFYNLYIHQLFTFVFFSVRASSTYGSTLIWSFRLSEALFVVITVLSTVPFF